MGREWALEDGRQNSEAGPRTDLLLIYYAPQTNSLLKSILCPHDPAYLPVRMTQMFVLKQVGVTCNCQVVSLLFLPVEKPRSNFRKYDIMKNSSKVEKTCNDWTAK